MSQSGRELLAALGDLRRSITAERIARWQGDIELPSFAASADNLAHYLAFRHHDLRDLQLELMRHGLSSLGRLESRVLITLRTVESALAALLSSAPAAPDWPPSAEQFFLGEAGLQANTHALLGGTADHESGRILVTLSDEAAQDPGYMLEIARRGADVVRINCAHDTADAWAAMIENTRKAGGAVGRRIRVLMDIAGPKFRIGHVKRQPGERLLAGDRFCMVADAAMFGSDAAIEAVCEPGDVLDHLAVGTEVGSMTASSPE
jgi:pyruvate kinase